MAVLYVLLNLAIDMLYGVIDPRVARLRGMSAHRHAIRAGAALRSCLAHARYVLGGEPGHRWSRSASSRCSCCSRSSARAIVPYDPLASDTAPALQPPERAALVRHRPARPRHPLAAWWSPPGSTSSSRCRGRAVVRRSAALAGACAGLLRRLAGPIVIGRHRRHDHGLPAVRAGHGHRRRAGQHGVNIVSPRRS